MIKIKTMLCLALLGAAGLPREGAASSSQLQIVQYREIEQEVIYYLILDHEGIEVELPEIASEILKKKLREIMHNIARGNIEQYGEDGQHSLTLDYADMLYYLIVNVKKLSDRSWPLRVTARCVSKAITLSQIYNALARRYGEEIKDVKRFFVIKRDVQHLLTDGDLYFSLDQPEPNNIYIENGCFFDITPLGALNHIITPFRVQVDGRIVAKCKNPNYARNCAIIELIDHEQNVVHFFLKNCSFDYPENVPPNFKKPIKKIIDILNKYFEGDLDFLKFYKHALVNVDVLGYQLTRYEHLINDQIGRYALLEFTNKQNGTVLEFKILTNPIIILISIRENINANIQGRSFRIECLYSQPLNSWQRACRNCTIC